MARDAFLQPFDGGTVAGATTVTTYGDPWNMPMGSGAAYSNVTDTKWLADLPFPRAATGSLRLGIGWGGAADAATRKVYKYNRTTLQWVIHASNLVIPDSTTWRHERWDPGTTAENPNVGRDNPVMSWASDKEAFTEMRQAYRYSRYLDFGGTPIAGANDKDIVIVLKSTQSLNYHTGQNPKEFAWKSLTASNWTGGAARTSKAGGAIRLDELTTSLGVKHAVVIACSHRYLNYGGAGNGNPYVWPAAGVDNDAAAKYDGDGNIYMGARLALLASLDLTTFAAAQAALGLETTQGWALARAVQDYGLYIVEGAGPGIGHMAVHGDNAVISTDLGGSGSTTHYDFLDDVARVIGACKVITNNYASGGGAPAGNIPGGSTGTLRRVLLDGFSGGTPVPDPPTTHVMVNAVVGGWTSQWDASGVLGETGFDLQYRTYPGGSYPGSPQITDIPAGATERIVTGIAAGDWAAQPRSKNASGNSAWANEATITVPGPPTKPAAPSNAAGTAIDYQTIDWTCQDNSTNEDGFKWWVSKNGAAYAQVGTTGSNVVTFRYTDPTPGSGGNTYQLRVYSYNAQGDSDSYAESEFVVTPAPPLRTDIVYPSSPIYPNAGSKVFPRTEDVKFPQ